MADDNKAVGPLATAKLVALIKAVMEKSTTRLAEKSTAVPRSPAA